MSDIVAAIISSEIYPLVMGPSQAGEVLSVFDGVVNLGFSSRLVAVHLKAGETGPFSLMLASGKEALALPERVVPGVPVAAGGGAVRFPSVPWVIQAGPGYVQPPLEALHPSPWLSREVWWRLWTLVRERALPGSLASAFIHPSRANQGSKIQVEVAEVFRRVLREMDQSWNSRELTAWVETATSLLGLGFGLTPSGDDFILGMLAGMRALREYDPPFWVDAFQALAQGVRGKLDCTNRISGEYLHYAARGIFSPTLTQLVRCLADGSAATAFFAHRVLQWGHYSGSDILTGLLACWLYGFRREEEEEIYHAN